MRIKLHHPDSTLEYFSALHAFNVIIDKTKRYVDLLGVFI